MKLPGTETFETHAYICTESFQEVSTQITIFRFYLYVRVSNSLVDSVLAFGPGVRFPIRAKTLSFTTPSSAEVNKGVLLHLHILAVVAF